MLHYTVMHLVHLAFCVEVGALCVCVCHDMSQLTCQL